MIVGVLPLIAVQKSPAASAGVEGMATWMPGKWAMALSLAWLCQRAPPVR